VVPSLIASWDKVMAWLMRNGWQKERPVRQARGRRVWIMGHFTTPKHVPRRENVDLFTAIVRNCKYQYYMSWCNIKRAANAV
jgi:hypothetical protein